MAPGILAQSVLFVAIFYGIAVERDLGIAHKFLTSPTLRRGVSVRQGAVGQSTQLVANLDAPLDLFSYRANTCYLLECKASRR
jgi:hypothetical protein